MSAPIRRRLVIAVVAFTAPVLAVGSLLLYQRVASTMRAQLDRELVGAAQVLSDLAERDEQGYEFELDSHTARVLAGEDAARVELWTAGGKVVYRSPELGGDLPRGGAIGAPAMRDLSIAGADYRAASIEFVPRTEDSEAVAAMSLTVARPTAELDRDLRRLQLWFLAVTGVLLLVSAWLVGRGVAVGLAPLARVRRDIDALDPGRLDERVDPDGVPPELAPLVDTVNRLLERHEEAFGRERRFTADAAHELRTPLAVLRTEIEVALRRDRDLSDYRGVLEGGLETVEGMTRSIDALLMIARADAGRVEVRPEPVAIAPLVESAWRTAGAIGERRGVELEVDIADDAVVSTDRGLMQVLVSNLVSNAAHHADPGAVRIASDLERGVVLSVANRASGLDPDDVDHLFERFWRRDAARTETAVHSGLGLSLVQSLATCLELDVSAALDGDRLTLTVRKPVRGEP